MSLFNRAGSVSETSPCHSLFGKTFDLCSYEKPSWSAVTEISVQISVTEIKMNFLI